MDFDSLPVFASDPLGTGSSQNASPLEDAGPSDNDGATPLMHDRLIDGTGDDFRADPSGVPHRDGKNRFVDWTHRRFYFFSSSLVMARSSSPGPVDPIQASTILSCLSSSKVVG